MSCLALFILTHGFEEGGLFVYDTSINLNDDIIKKLIPTNCPGLAGRPKLLFVQACQGEKTDSGSELTFGATNTLRGNIEWYESVHIYVWIVLLSYYLQQYIIVYRKC